MLLFFGENLKMRYPTRFIFALFLGSFFVFANCSNDSGKTCTKNEDCTSGKCVSGKCASVSTDGSTLNDGGSKDAQPPKACAKDTDCPLDKRCKNKFVCLFPILAKTKQNVEKGNSAIPKQKNVKLCLVHLMNNVQINKPATKNSANVSLLYHVARQNPVPLVMFVTLVAEFVPFQH